MFKEYFDVIAQILNENSIDNAIALCKKAASIIPKHSFSYILLIIYYIKKNDIKTAQEYCMELEKHNPNFKFTASSNIETALIIFILKHLISVQTPFAEADFEKIVAINPDLEESYVNASIGYLMQNDINNAYRVIDNGLNIFPDSLSLLYNKSAVLMKSDKLENAWEFYEKREQIHKHHKLLLDNIEKFAFQKENINLLVYSTAGFGDTIFYSRYLEMLKQKNLNVFLKVQPALKSLYKTLGYNVIDDVNSFAFDYQISFMSLGSLFKTSLDTIPFSGGYINLPKKEKLQAETGIKKIGLVWRSGAKTNRSLNIEMFKDIFELNNVQFYSLQKDISQDEKDVLEKYNIVDLKEKLSDFQETAFYINDLDMIIGCDTAVTNLSAAMGKETYVLAPYFCDFRWGVSEFWTPWYESVKIFRQVIQDDWSKPLDNLLKYINQ